MNAITLPGESVVRLAAEAIAYLEARQQEIYFQRDKWVRETAERHREERRNSWWYRWTFRSKSWDNLSDETVLRWAYDAPVFGIGEQRTDRVYGRAALAVASSITVLRRLSAMAEIAGDAGVLVDDSTYELLTKNLGPVGR